MKHSPTRVLATVAIALAAGTALSPAYAGTQVSITQNGFTPSRIVVTSEDGKTWSKIATKDLVYNVTVGMGKTDHRIWGFKVRQHASQSSDANHTLYEYMVLPGDHYPIRYDHSFPVKGSTAHFNAAERQAILAACNSKLNVGKGIHQTHTFFRGVKLSLRTQFIDEGLSQLTAAEDSVSMATTVECKGRPWSPGNVASEQPKELKVRSIDLFRTTYANQFSKPNPATKCKKARLLVRVKTNKAGPVKFKLWKKVGDQPMSSKMIDGWAKFSGPGEYKAEYSEWVTVNKTSFVQAKAEEHVNAIGMSTSWKSITLHCTGAGGGGLADRPKPNNDGPIAQPLKVTGSLTLADQAGAPKDKPRLGAAVFTLRPNKPGPTSYRLTCSGGRQWTGTLNTFKAGASGYRADGQHTFQISKTEQIGCAVRSTSLPNNGLVALATKLFVMKPGKPAIDAADNLSGTPNGRPAHSRPGKRPLKDKLEEAKRRRLAAKLKAERLRKRKAAAARKAAALRKQKAAAKRKAAQLRKRKAAAAKKAAARRAAKLRKARAAAARKARLRQMKRQRAQQLLRQRQRALQVRKARRVRNRP